MLAEYRQTERIGEKMNQICMVTNNPAPYREPIHELLFHKLEKQYHVIYCQEREAKREWEFPYRNYSRTFLKKRVFKYKERFIHINPDIWSKLDHLCPEIVITTGFNPTFLMAFLWCIKNKKKHICMTDAWLRSEAKFSFIHQKIRRIVFKNSVAFIGASKHSMDLYRFYGCNESALFQSHLCVDNEYFAKFIHSEKKYDIMFSGRLAAIKMPLFFCEVAKKIKEKRNSCTALILGSGPLKDSLLNCLNQFGIEYCYAGFIQQYDLPRYYASSRFFLFPSRNDPWGVVANEACAVGVPVLTCKNAGAAYDLIKDGENGFILPTHAEIWANKVVELLNNPTLYEQLSKKALSSVRRFNYNAATQGIIDALEYARKF